MSESDKEKANANVLTEVESAGYKRRAAAAKESGASTSSLTGPGQPALSPETESILGRIQAIQSRISGLDPELKSKALAILMQTEFGPTPAIRGTAGPPGVTDASAQGNTVLFTSETSFDELVGPFGPKDQAEWGLLASFYMSRVKGGEEISSQDVNTILKHHGHGVSHITRVLDSLTPTLLIQVRKSGTTRQARKTYKLTTTGAKEVESRLKNSGGGTDQ